MIEFDEVTYRYPGAEGGRPAVDAVSLTVEPGRILALVGANGSGKSTVARLADGLLVPDGGSVRVDGLDTAEVATMWDVRALVGMVFQDPEDAIVGTFVEEDAAFGPENLGVDPAQIRVRVDAALEAVGLTALARREPHLLSDGQKQRLAIAGALAMDPAYMVFDEPTALLDPEGRSDVLVLVDRLAREHGHGVLLVSHDAAGVALADRVIGLQDGRVSFDGDPAAFLADPALLERLGLALPPIGRLAASLRADGVSIPARAMDAESVVAALWA